MRLRTSNKQNEQNSGSVITNNELYNQVNLLKNIFTEVILVNPLEQSAIGVEDYQLRNINKQCTEICPLSKDKCGCICKDTISTTQERYRFVYNKKEAFLVISKFIKMQYRDYTMVMILKLNTQFAFGALPEATAIEQITKLSSSLVIDPLTQIFNRKYLMDNIEFMMRDAASQSKQLCLACIDIDNFKRFNDTYGHDFGDIVLKNVARLMSESIKVIEESYPIRIGGDEFLIIGVNISKQRFKSIMNKLCILVDNCKLPYKNQKVSIRISIGVSEMMADQIDNYKDLYEKADKQLYEAKEAGKGCVR